MLKKSIFTICTLLSITTHADVCPSATDIQTNMFAGWRAFDIDNGTPASAKRLATFQKQVMQFALAEWMDQASEGSGHCYYFGKNPTSGYLNLFLAKPQSPPTKTNKHWRSLSESVMQCNRGLVECEFAGVPAKKRGNSFLV